jgi:hypothetical protein
MRRRPARQLRTAIDCLPVDTRRAMLDGMDANRIIVGAYTDRHGGVCPMLAAHRHGGRTALASFARAWDRYTGAGNGPRPATERELRTLRTMLEASIVIESGVSQTELGRAIAEYRASRGLEEVSAAEAKPKRDTGERDRSKELKREGGWSWLRPFRRLDEYERAVAELEDAEATECELTPSPGAQAGHQPAEHRSSVTTSGR